MQTHSITTYSFEELTPEAQSKAINDNRDINTDDNYWYEYTLEAQKELLASYGFNDPRIFFSGFYSQGDGACFTTNNIDLSKLVEHLPLTKQEKNKLKKLDLSLSVIRCGTYNLYSHEHTASMEVDYHGFSTNQAHLAEKFEYLAENLRLSLCKRIYKELYDEYDRLQSDDEVKEILIANEYEFLADGTFYKC